MCLLKFEKDVIECILESRFLKDHTLNLSNWALVENRCIELFDQFKNSYYFKNRYEGSSFDDNFREQLYDIIEEKSIHALNKNFIIDEFISDLNNSLLEKDPVYACYFESNSIKQKINLINKFDLTYSWVSVKDESLFKILKNYHQIDNSLKFNEIKDYLNHEIGLSFIHDSQRNREFLICHNKNEIAGIASLPSSSHFKNFENKDNIKAISYIAVNNSFRGHNIGVSLFREIYEKAKKEEWILVRTSPSEDGNLFLKDKINATLKDHADSIVIDHDKIIIYKDLLTTLEKEKDKSLFYQKALVMLPNIAIIEKLYDNCEDALSLNEDITTRIAIIEQRNQMVNDVIKSTHNSRKCTIN